MNLHHLRTFVAIAEAGGIARAGARLNLSQPAASRQILLLEADLGVRLFDRIGRRFKLTSEGEDLLWHCRRLLLDADSVVARARALTTGQTGILRVGAPPQTIESLLVGFLTSYGRRHPGVEVHLVEDGGVRLPGRLDRGDAHLIVTAGDEGRFPNRLLYPVYVLAVLAEGHRLRRHPVIEVAELADEPLLRLGHGFASREWFDAACLVAHIRPHVFLESAAPQTLIALAAAGRGVALVPSTVLITRENVRAVPVVHRGAPIGRWGHIAWHPQRFLARYAEQFIEELVVHVRRDYPGRSFTRRAPPLPRPKEPATSLLRSARRIPARPTRAPGRAQRGAFHRGTARTIGPPR